MYKSKYLRKINLKLSIRSSIKLADKDLQRYVRNNIDKPVFYPAPGCILDSDVEKERKLQKLIDKTVNRLSNCETSYIGAALAFSDSSGIGFTGWKNLG